MQKEEIKFILLSCCTYKRPSQLKSLLSSINELILPDNIKTEILIIDNDKNETAKEVIEEYKNILNLKINYFVENKAGLTNARNRLLEEAIKLNATHLFMFDDDEILDKNSLIEHINLYNKYEEDVICSGIAINTFDMKTPKFFQNNMIFKKKTRKKTGTVKGSCATDNIFLSIKSIQESKIRFSEEFNFSGGEDMDFTQKLSNIGYKIVQNTESIVYEPVLYERATIKYIIKRAYFGGFCGAYAKFKKKKNILKQLLYLINLLIVLFFNFILLIFSIFCGLSVFFNIFTKIIKTFGKIGGTIQLTPIDFYKK